MATLESLGTVLSADLLIVGGGMAGLACAISAKETDPEVDVLVLDKVVSGWGGKANKGGGNISYVTEEDGFETFLRYHVENMGALPGGPGPASRLRASRRARTSTSSSAGACTSSATTPASPSTCAGRKSCRGASP